MRIEVWSDYVCPLCYLGKRSLEQALEEFQHKQNVVIEYKSYELDPDAKEAPGITDDERLAKRYKITIEEAKTMKNKIIAKGAELGLNYEFDIIQHTNSFDAHRLAKLAKKEGKNNDIVEHLLKAYFTEGRLISEHETLLDIAEKIGLDYEKTETTLGSCKYTSHVRDDQDQAKQMGVESVPFFVFNEKYALSGPQPVSVIKEVLARVWEEDEHGLHNSLSEYSETSYCTDEGCQINNN